MTKFLVRLFIVFTALYFCAVYILAYNGIVWFNDAYIIIAEIAICSIATSQGKYHCKYIHYLGWGIVSSDSLTRLDNRYDFLPVEVVSIIPISLIALGFVFTLITAIRHFIRVQKIKKAREN